jgi:DnaJ-class molecular chaperone
MAYGVLSDPVSKDEYDLYIKSAEKEKNYWNWQAGENTD